MYIKNYQKLLLYECNTKNNIIKKKLIQKKMQMITKVLLLNYQLVIEKLWITLFPGSIINLWSANRQDLKK